MSPTQQTTITFSSKSMKTVEDAVSVCFTGNIGLMGNISSLGRLYLLFHHLFNVVVVGRGLPQGPDEHALVAGARDELHLALEHVLLGVGAVVAEPDVLGQPLHALHRVQVRVLLVRLCRPVDEGYESLVYVKSIRGLDEWCRDRLKSMHQVA